MSNQTNTATGYDITTADAASSAVATLGIVFLSFEFAQNVFPMCQKAIGSKVSMSNPSSLNDNLLLEDREAAINSFRGDELHESFYCFVDSKSEDIQGPNLLKAMGMWLVCLLSTETLLDHYFFSQWVATLFTTGLTASPLAAPLALLTALHFVFFGPFLFSLGGFSIINLLLCCCVAIGTR